MENKENKIFDTDKIKSVEISKNMQSSFLSYAMSVIVARALPDVRDGLKPVHRRIIYAMDELNARPNIAHKKSARIVGDVLGKYHPHGDSSVYDAMVRMAQDFNYRYPLVDGHGNFGSIDGDGAAAQRYTEARMSNFSTLMMRDIKKNTVDFVDNYTNDLKEPSVLPSKFPNLLVNGTMGIAVGMATNIPPHNLTEVINASIAYIENNDITTNELMQHIKGPDFPTGASILGNSGIQKAYETGKGSITIRSKAEIVEKKNRNQIIITELPYQVNKTNLITKIAELVRDKSIEGISNLTDSSNLDGIKIVIDLRREANANVVLNNLYRQTALQTSYGINLLAIVHGEPKILTLREMLEHYINHQKEVIIRRTKFDLDAAEKRLHILEGLKIALENIDDVIAIIRGSTRDDEAKNKLMRTFNLSEVQSEAILEMRLRRLTSLEIDKIIEEHEQLLKLVEELKAILASEEKILNIIKEELEEIKRRFGDERRTDIDMTAIEYIEDESLIPEENIIVSLTTNGYIKRINASVYRSQNRGGVGVKGMSTNEEDSVEELLNLSTHDYILFFTDKGKVYRLKGYEIPEFQRTAKGIPVINLLQLDPEEEINSVIHLPTDSEDKYFVFGTKMGLVKRTNIEEFDSIRVTGKIAITLNDEDELIGVKKSDGTNNVLLGSTDGRMVVFEEDEVRVMGRTAKGVRGINLNENEECIGIEVANDDSNILLVTEKGYGKKTYLTEYRKTKRASKGVKALNLTDKNGKLISFKQTFDNSDLMIVTDEGTIIRMPLDQVSQLGRVTQGTRLINLKDDHKVSGISVVTNEEEKEETANLPDSEVKTKK